MSNTMTVIAYILAIVGFIIAAVLTPFTYRIFRKDRSKLDKHWEDIGMTPFDRFKKKAYTILGALMVNSAIFIGIPIWLLNSCHK